MDKIRSFVIYSIISIYGCLNLTLSTYGADPVISAETAKLWPAALQIYDELIKRFPSREYQIIYSGRKSTLHWLAAWSRNPSGFNRDYFFHPLKGYHYSNETPLYWEYLFKLQKSSGKKLVLFRELDMGGVVARMATDLNQLRHPGTNSILSVLMLATRPRQRNFSSKYAHDHAQSDGRTKSEVTQFLPREFMLLEHPAFINQSGENLSYNSLEHPFTQVGLSDREWRYQTLAHLGEQERFEFLFRNRSINNPKSNLYKTALEALVNPVDPSWRIKYLRDEEKVGDCDEIYQKGNHVSL